MSMNDPLSDMLTRIRNGQQAGKPVIEVPFSRLHENVANVLKDEGFIREVRTETTDGKKNLLLELKYAEGKGVIRVIDRVSKPGRRVYTNVKTMPRFYNGLGILIVSTPQGVMPDSKARAANVGGEILCQVF
ncbi:MAG TPA: 30S ribosomal protein S8 [Alphaproteobacteria bacterium]|jgi:small subunit ribosomal protein S8|nr:30S ribosomal protein S8 [Micavibrio sp.]MBK9562032.1 30S ribosomal protein S8 [Micavibrio sp.]HQX26373.1 30S ribosomal protein S8 [Alphaproteobacteria bacterium]